MLLLAAVAALLPAQRASADQQNVVLSRDEVNNVFYRWLFEHPDIFQKRAIMVEDLIRTGLVLNTPNADSEETLKQLDEFEHKYFELLGERGADAEYRASLPFATLAQASFNAAVQTPVLKGSAEKVYRELKAAASDPLSNERYNASERVTLQAIQEGIASSDGYKALLDEYVKKAEERAKTDPKYRHVWDQYWASHTEYSIEEIDALTVLADHPDAFPQQVKAAMRPDGSMEISLADLQQLATTEFGKINASIDDMQKTLVTLSAQQGQLVDFMRNQELRQKAQALAEAKAREHQLKLQAASSSVYIVSTLVGFKDPKLGKQIATIGNSAIQIGESLNGWMQAVAGLNGLSKLTSLSTVVMTGNVLGAVMNIYSLFGPQQPTPEQIILEEIGKLRQQVSELRTEMHSRFDQVDKELTTIYTTMNERFNQIDVQLGKINGSLAEIQQSLLTLSLTLNRMERNNFEYLDALGRRPLREAINGALDYKQRTGLDMPYQPEFVTYENIFHTWGTENAFDALSAGPSQRDYSDGQVLAELSAAPLDANVNYLNGWLSAHGMRPFASKRLASPRDWAFASRAYAQLGLDWPAHLKRINPQRQASLDAVGNDLQQALQNISTIQTPSGPQGNAPLFTGVTAYYTAKLQALDSALADSETAYVKDVQASLRREGPFDLYGGLDQSLASLPNDFKTITCGGTAPYTLATPRYLKNMISDYNRFALADYLQVSPLKVCAYAGWVNLDPPCVGGPGTCDRYGELLVGIDVYSDQVLLVRRYIVGQRTKYSDANIWDLITPEWSTYWKRAFEVMFAYQTTPPPLAPYAAQHLATVSSALASKLAEHRRAHASRVLGELTHGPLQTSVVELGGAKKLLESFITLGFPQAINSDDLLRSLLFSKEALIDGQQIASVYAPPPLSATQAISEAQLLINPRVKLLQTGQKRRDALAKLLTDYLGGISTEAYSEDNALIGGARFDMVMARTFADAPRPIRRVFLPLVRR
jgi:hypothetical protein